MSDTITTKPAAKRPRKMARQPRSEPCSGTSSAAAPSPAASAPTKISLVLDLLRRGEGSSLAEMAAATGWLPHTTRAALTGLKKKGHAIAKQKVDGVSRYTIAPAASV